VGDSSKWQDDLNFAFDQRESEVNLHKGTSLPESPSNVSPGYTQGSLNSTIGPRSKQYTGAPTYTTTHKNKNVNGQEN
jgi:hypothetical protein